LEEVAHIGGRLAGAAKNTAVAAKDAVVHAGEFTKEKAIAAKDYVLGETHHDPATTHPDWFRDTGVDKKEVLEERDIVLGKHHEGSHLDQAFTTEKKDVQDVTGGLHDAGKREFSSGLGDTALDQRDALGGFHDTGMMDSEKREGGFHDSEKNWFRDTGVDKKEVMEERKVVLGETAGIDKDIGKFGEKAGEKREGFGDSAHNWFQDTGVDKGEVMEERRAVLGERTDVSNDRFDNTSNTLANKAGQLKDTVSEKAGQLKDSALEKGGVWKDAALEHGGQLKDAALEKGAQLKDAAFDKGQQLKESAIVKGQQAKESALEKGDQLKGKAIDAGHALQEKGIAMKAAHEKGFGEQEARADKENVRY